MMMVDETVIATTRLSIGHTHTHTERWLRFGLSSEKPSCNHTLKKLEFSTTLILNYSLIH